MMYAPTFRAGSQGTNRMIKCDELNLNFSTVIKSFEGKFGGIWFVFLRLHPQLAVRHLSYELADNHVIDVTNYDDIYELLAGCDAVLTDYSSVLFDGITAGLPTFLYMEDYDEYLAERGCLVWNVTGVPISIAKKETELLQSIKEFDMHKYKKAADDFVESIQLCEDGCASKKTVDYIEKMLAE